MLNHDPYNIRIRYRFKFSDDDKEEKNGNKIPKPDITNENIKETSVETEDTEDNNENLKPQNSPPDTTKSNLKKPSIETDIRVKNYVETLIPIKIIRQRFRVKRREEDEEDFLNYV